ncbi:unnamed protein product [Blepharisma stoltei]|uniref:Uncharacterized protein n=1 Tax=Blepharisma stoltei TaxID=1481888 RepID=A0AAU9IZM9_9CILI|nr:unnamed protein product [Blepharisma stoltei]
MRIIVRYLEQNIELIVDANAKVKDLQLEISRITSIPPNLQKLSFLNSGNKAFLPSSSKLSYYNIKDRSVLFLEQKTIDNPQSPDEDVRIVRRYSHQASQDEIGTIYQEQNAHRAMSYCYESENSNNLAEWVTKAVIACREGNAEGLIETLQDYQVWRGSKLQEEDVGELLNSPYNGQWSCIHYACYMNHVNILKELLELGVNCNNITDDQWTPLQISAYQGNIHCVELLLAHPLIQINLMTAVRGSALHMAAVRGHFEIVKLLLENKADIGLEDPDHKTALELSSDRKIAELIPKYNGVKMLERFGQKNYEKPLGFCGEVWSTGTWHINDKIVFLILDSEKGKFMHYDQRDSYIEEKQPEITVPFEDITKVIADEVLNDKYFFSVITKDITLKYYTQYQDMTEEWTRRVDWCIVYFHHEARLKNAKAFTVPKKIPVKSQKKIVYEEEPYENIGESAIKKSSFEILGEIGSGSFGNVYQVRKKDSGEIFAMKALSKPMLISKNQLKYAVAECKILKAIKFPFIVRLYWAFQSQSYLYMILEFCPNGDFSSLLQLAGHLSTEVAKFYIAEMILAIEYLHSFDIIYRDLKPQNLLLDSEGHIKLTDFGLSKENVSDNEPAMSFCGSPAYLPPEVLAQTGCGKSADIYSIGTNLYEMLVGKPPFYTENVAKLYKRISKSSIKFPEDINEDAMDLIQKVMVKNPEERPFIHEVKAHRFFEGVDWDNMLQKKMTPPINIKNLRNLRSSHVIS